MPPASYFIKEAINIKKEELKPLVLEEEKKISKKITEEPLVLDNIYEENLESKNVPNNISPAARKMASESKLDLEKVNLDRKNCRQF